MGNPKPGRWLLNCYATNDSAQVVKFESWKYRRVGTGERLINVQLGLCMSLRASLNNFAMDLRRPRICALR